MSLAARHFLLSAAARLGEDQVREAFRALRRHATDGEPVRPACGCLAGYAYRTRPSF